MMFQRRDNESIKMLSTAIIMRVSGEGQGVKRYGLTVFSFSMITSQAEYWHRRV
jgi:hypothetical protein